MVRIFICILIVLAAQFAGALIKDRSTDREDVAAARFVRLIGSAVGVVALVVLALFSGIYTTTDQEIGFVNKFGVNTPITASGIKWKTPFVSTAYVYPGTTQSMTIGYIEEREDSEDYTENTAESSMITSDFNFIEVDAYLEYQIIDPIAYHFATADPVGILRNAALVAIKNNVGLTNVDAVMTTGRAQLEAQITDTIIKELETHDTGLTLVKVSIQDVSLPTNEVKEAFTAVETAKQNAEKKRNEANAYEYTHLPEAEAEATRIITAANAARTERVNEAQAEVSKFEALWTQFRNSEVVREKLYYDTLVEILPGMDIIISPDGRTVFVKGNNADVSAAGAAGVSQ